MAQLPDARAVVPGVMWRSTLVRVALCALALGLCVASSRGIATAQAQVPTTAASAGAKTMLVEPPAPLLPHRFGAWEQVKSELDGSEAAEMNGASEMAMKEDGLTRFASSSYKRDGSNQTILIKAYQFVDACGAVAAYSYYRSPTDRPAPQLKLGSDAFLDHSGLTFRSGTTLVMTNFNEALLTSDLASLVSALPKASGSAGIAPMLPTLVPGKDIDADSVRYALGPRGYTAEGGVLPVEVIGFDKSAEVVSARNASGGLLMLLLYPTPQIAGEHERMIDAVLKGTGPGPTVVGGASTRTVKMRREGTLVLLALGDWPTGEAERTVNAIHLHEEVTWNKPVPLDFHTEVRKTFTLLESIAFFCGFSAIAMLVLGLFFGYGRALIRVMQGKPAASEPEFLRIDLRGALGKKLGDPED